MINDQYSDKSFRVLYSKLKQFPEETKDLVKTASINYEDVDTLPTTAFAWPEMRKFAMHTKEHTVLSAVYSSGEDVPTHVESNIKKAMELYGVEVASTEEKTAEAVENIGDYLVPHMRVGKMTDSESVKEAARFFCNNSKKMNMETRVNAAVSLVKKAKVLDVKIPSRIYKHAGLTEVNRTVMAEWIEARKEVTKEESIREGFDKLASFVGDKNTSISSRKDLLKVADAIHKLDKKANLQKYYDRSLPDPVLTVFNTAKLAEETVTLAGKNIAVSKLMALPVETYSDVLGDDIIPEITDGSKNLDQSSLLSVLKTLPADIQISMVTNLGL